MSTLAARRPTVSARHLMWLPAGLLLAWGLLAAAGVQLTPSSRAAASTGSTTISATVLPDIHTTGSTCAGASITGVSFAPGVNDTLLGGCSMVFGTTNGASGAQLRVEHPRPAGNVAFCQQATPASACAGGTFTDALYNGVGVTDIPDGSFGVKANAVTTCSTPTWTAGNLYGLRAAATAPGTGDLICDRSAGTDATYALQFYADPSAAQVSGLYYAQADFTAEAF